MVYFIVVLGLLVLGGLVGNSLSTPNFNSTFWSMFSAIGSWAGGIAAAYAAYLAVKIADRQINRDNYRIYAYKSLTYDVPLGKLEEKLNKLLNHITNNSTQFRVTVANTGLRPIQLIYLRFNNDIFNVTIEWPGAPVLQPGCSVTHNFKQNHGLITMLSGNDELLSQINSTDIPVLATLKWLFNSTIMLEVATGEQHLVAEKKK